MIESPVVGFVDKAFEPVRDTFIDNFEHYGVVGDSSRSRAARLRAKVRLATTGWAVRSPSPTRSGALPSAMS